MIELVEMLIGLYAEENSKLTTLAAVALTNLCANDKLMKKKVMECGVCDVIFNQAFSNDQNL